MKIAFVHLMRTGGTYLREQFAVSGVPLLCSWHKGLDRDWTRAELFDQMREPEGLIHNHMINWDLETITSAKQRGWRTITVIREPIWQLTSLYNFMLKWFSGVDIDEFIAAQIGQKWLWIDYRHWAIPDWIGTIDDVLIYSPNMFPILKSHFNLSSPDMGRFNESAEKHLPQASTIQLVRASEFHQRFLNALGNDNIVPKPIISSMFE